MMKTITLLTALIFATSQVHAGNSLPPRTQWAATSSSQQVPALAPAHAIDGDDATKWGGAFDANQWLQVDLGKAEDVGGVLIHWDSGFAASYTIQTSMDEQHWQQAYATTTSHGGIEDIFFPAVKARYVRLASVPKTADWGVSVFEFEPLAASEAARIDGLDTKGDAACLWQEGASRSVVRKGTEPGTRMLEIALPRALNVAGLDVMWDGPRHGATLQGRDSDGRWTTLASDPGSLGNDSYLAADGARSLSGLRLVVGEMAGEPPKIKQMVMLAAPRAMTPMKRYEIVASRANASLFPASLHQQQTYWTVTGIPAGRQKSIFDEYGNIEAFKGAPLVQPIWRDEKGAAAAAAGHELTHALRANWMPMPSVAWSPQPGLTMLSEAFTIEQHGQPVTLLRHRLSNTGKHAVDGTLSLVVRPMQMNPPWQNGGLSPIQISRSGVAATTPACT